MLTYVHLRVEISNRCKNTVKYRKTIASHWKILSAFSHDKEKKRQQTMFKRIGFVHLYHFVYIHLQREINAWMRRSTTCMSFICVQIFFVKLQQYFTKASNMSQCTRSLSVCFDQPFTPAICYHFEIILFWQKANIYIYLDTPSSVYVCVCVLACLCTSLQQFNQMIAIESYASH